MNSKSKKLLVLGLAAFTLGGCVTEGQDNGKQEGPAVVVTYSMTVESSVSLNIGATHTLAVQLQGFTAAEVSFESYDEEIVTVDANGVLTGVKEGTAQVHVQAVHGDTIKNATCTVEVIDPNKINGLIPFNTAKNMAKLSSDETTIEYTGAPIINYGWDITPGMSHGDSTAAKFDFENTKALTEKVGRGAAVKKANVYSGDYVVVMRAGNGEVDTTKAAAVSYFKGDVSPWAVEFRCWGWSSKNDLDEYALSGAGKFRIVAYEAKNANYNEFDAIPLVATATGTLEQDANGWITFDDVSNVAEGQIANAPDYNMFQYAVNVDGKYDIRGKNDLIFACEFMATDKVAGKYDCFGIKRWGFCANPKPDITLASASSVELFAGKTSQITVNTVGDATNGTNSYATSDATVATVSSAGLITAANVTEEKSCTITITNDRAPGKSLSVAVNVKPTPATSFDVPEKIDCYVGETAQINVTNQVSCDDGFTYESAFAGYATVSSTGLVTGVEPGSVKVKVTCGELYKYVTVNVKTKTLYGMTSAQASSLGSINGGGFPVAFDLCWGAKVADNVVTSNDDLTQAKIHEKQLAGNTVFENNTDSVGMISGIGGDRTDLAQMALWAKTNVPTTPNEFRIWINTPVENADMLDTAKFRVVFYLPNADYTEYTAYTFGILGTSDFADLGTATADENGMVTIKMTTAGKFMQFTTPDAVKGKTGFLSFESYSIANAGNKQSRIYVRRFGWDAAN